METRTIVVRDIGGGRFATDTIAADTDEALRHIRRGENPIGPGRIGRNKKLHAFKIEVNGSGTPHFRLVGTLAPDNGEE